MPASQRRRPDSWRFKNNQMTPEEAERYKWGIAATAKAMLTEQEHRDFYANRPDLRSAPESK